MSRLVAHLDDLSINEKHGNKVKLSPLTCIGEVDYIACGLKFQPRFGSTRTQSSPLTVQDEVKTRDQIPRQPDSMNVNRAKRTLVHLHFTARLSNKKACQPNSSLSLSLSQIVCRLSF